MVNNSRSNIMMSCPRCCLLTKKKSNYVLQHYGRPAASTTTYRSRINYNNQSRFVLLLTVIVCLIFVFDTIPGQLIAVVDAAELKGEENKFGFSSTHIVALEYLKQLKKDDPNIIELESGLIYKIVKGKGITSGSSSSSTSDDSSSSTEIDTPSNNYYLINYHVKGYVTNLIIDSTYDKGRKPIKVDINSKDHMIDGIKEALLKMNVGDKWQLYVKAHLGYGHAGTGNSFLNNGLGYPIPGMELLIVNLELVDIIINNNNNGDDDNDLQNEIEEEKNKINQIKKEKERNFKNKHGGGDGLHDQILDIIDQHKDKFQWEDEDEKILKKDLSTDNDDDEDDDNDNTMNIDEEEEADGDFFNGEL